MEQVDVSLELILVGSYLRLFFCPVTFDFAEYDALKGLGGSLCIPNSSICNLFRPCMRSQLDRSERLWSGSGHQGGSRSP